MSLMLELETQKKFLSKYVKRLNKRFCKNQPMKVKFTMSWNKYSDAFATYDVEKHICDFHLNELTRVPLVGLRGLSLHEFGHHVESQLIDNIFLWDIKPIKRNRWGYVGNSERKLRETLADNFGYIVDLDAMREFGYSIQDIYKVNATIRNYDKRKDFWYDEFLRMKKRYDIPRVNPRAFENLRKTKEIRLLIQRL